ncbi:RDD family protein [Enterococcus camelliae]|uniref:RDD family protein n=1 Tax=Enterococcus camelliae TaxID=453959 RepID=A0ABW5TIR3_9ENTE
MTRYRSEDNNEFYQQLINKRKPAPIQGTSLKQAQEKWSGLNPENFHKEPDFPTYFFVGFWIRMWAFLIDLLCIKGITVATIGFFARFQILEPNNSLLSIYGLLAAGLYYGYFILLTKYNHGQTIGKMIFGIRVVSLVDAELTWQTVLMREGVGRFILSFPWVGLLGYLPILGTTKKQQLADYFSETSVVSLTTLSAFSHRQEVLSADESSQIAHEEMSYNG